jgi:hypothetical protein
MQYQWFALLVIGFGIGWLTGLSVTPVVAAVLTTLLALASSLVAVLQVIDQRQSGNLPLKLPSANAGPLAALVTGIAVGATGGIIARTHHWLEPYGSEIIRASDAGVLFGFESSECDSLYQSWLNRNIIGIREQLKNGSSFAKRLNLQTEEDSALLEKLGIECQFPGR